jgi:hypothetical protein
MGDSRWCEMDADEKRLETRYDNDTAEYVAIVTYPDGRKETERFGDADLYRRWLESWERTLEADHWTRRGPPVVVPDEIEWTHQREALERQITRTVQRIQQLYDDRKYDHSAEQLQLENQLALLRVAWLQTTVVRHG